MSRSLIGDGLSGHDISLSLFILVSLFLEDVVLHAVAKVIDVFLRGKLWRLSRWSMFYPIGLILIFIGNRLGYLNVIAEMVELVFRSPRLLLEWL